MAAGRHAPAADVVSGLLSVPTMVVGPLFRTLFGTLLAHVAKARPPRTTSCRGTMRIPSLRYG